MDPIKIAGLGVILVLVAFAGVVTDRFLPKFSSKDADAIRDTITRQLGAFLTDDAAMAFAHAAPRIRYKYRTGNAYLDAVRKAYQPIYRPETFSFGELVKAHTGPTQTVHLKGPKGNEWVAYYFMEEQPDKAWKVAGFHLREVEGQEV